MIPNNKIGVFGCGWLGLPLSKFLLKKKFFIRGSTTNQEKIKELKKHKIEPYLVELKETGIFGDIDSFLKDLDTLIINIPPKIKNNSDDSYIKKIKFLESKINYYSIDKVIFISSTSVYGSNQKKIDSKTKPEPNTKRGNEIIKSEKVITKNNNGTIIRFGGLIGNNRHPVYTLSKKKEVLNPNAPINLIHLDDCINIIYNVIKKKAWGKIFLGVAPFHPKKIDYYNEKCEEFGLKKINFIDKHTSKKEVNDSKIQSELGYEFIFPKL
jgi:nucleoside-diphosphate-sugar epimerase